MTLKDWVDVATIFSLLVASGVAIFGLNTWRVLTKRKFDWELARRCSRAIYAERDALQAARILWVTGNELIDAVTQARKAPLDLGPKEIESEYASYSTLWESVIEADTALGAELLEVEAVWGRPARDVISTIRALRNRLQTAATDYLESIRMPGLSGFADWTDIYNTGTAEEPDGFTKALNSAVKVAEDYLIEKMKL